MTTSYVTVTDQFCGAGGSSIGATKAGAELRLALNHWKLAIETHNANFPKADHDCTDIQACDPRRYPSTTILLTSPECTNHTLAKGKSRKMRQQADMFGPLQIDPAEERSRATMWDVPRFAEVHRYQAIVVENVVEARWWEPFEAWIMAMQLLGYKHKIVYLNSMFAHPTPQSRDRMYVVFWQKGLRDPDLDIRPRAHCPRCSTDVASVQSWKNPMKPWGKYRQQYIYCCPVCALEVTPYYYAAANAIDWSLPAPRIGDRKRPLKEKTRNRIAIGLQKFGAQAQVVRNYSPGFTRPVSDPVGTITTADHHALCVPPFITSYYTRDGNQAAVSGLDQALPTVPGRATHYLTVPPFLVQMEHSRNEDGTLAIAQPLHTQTSAQATGMVIPPFLTSYYSSGENVSSIKESIPTVTTHDRHTLVIPQAIPDVDDCGFRMLQPHEIGAAMAFPSEYQVFGTQRDQVKQYGNAVTPPVMQLLLTSIMEILG